MNAKTQIDCALHDYIEIACLYRYRIRLKMVDNRVIEGIASDIITTQDKRETLLIENDDKQTVELTRIDRIQVLTPGAKFTEIVF